MTRVLSIDDSKAVHAYLGDCFANSNIEVSHAYTGAEGLELMSKGRFELIFLDWEMPGMTGPEVLTEIVNRKIATPVIMLTSKNNLSDISEMLEKGAQEYVMKPFTPDILFSKIESVIGVTVKKG